MRLGMNGYFPISLYSSQNWSEDYSTGLIVLALGQMDQEQEQEQDQEQIEGGKAGEGE